VRGDTPTGNTTFINVNSDLAEYMADPRVLAVAEGCFGPVPHTRVGGTSGVVLGSSTDPVGPTQPAGKVRLPRST
jgi:hypothetical protein